MNDDETIRMKSSEIKALMKTAWDAALGGGTSTFDSWFLYWYESRGEEFL